MIPENQSVPSQCTTDTNEITNLTVTRLRRHILPHELDELITGEWWKSSHAQFSHMCAESETLFDGESATLGVLEILETKIRDNRKNSAH